MEAVSKLIMERKEGGSRRRNTFEDGIQQREKNMMEQMESLLCISHSAKVVEAALKASRQEAQRKISQAKSC